MHDPDNGVRRIKGKLGKAIAVRSHMTTDSGRALWYVTLRMEDELITLVHDSADRHDPAVLDGMWAACDNFSEQITGFPQNLRMYSGIGNDAARISRRCALT